MKKKRLILAVLVLALVFSAGIGGTWAYFTTYAQAEGGLPIALGNEREFHEGFSDWTKTLTVTNKPDSIDPIYVRARVFWPEKLYLGPERTPIEPKCEIYGEGWSGPVGDYYYYNAPVMPSESTTELTVKINGLPEKDSPLLEELEKGDAFNVIVVYESIPVVYNAEGEPIAPQAADWTRELVQGSTEGGLEP